MGELREGEETLKKGKLLLQSLLFGLYMGGFIYLSKAIALVSDKLGTGMGQKNPWVTIS